MNLLKYYFHIQFASTTMDGLRERQIFIVHNVTNAQNKQIQNVLIQNGNVVNLILKSIEKKPNKIN